MKNDTARGAGTLDAIVEPIARFATDLRYEDIPERVRAVARQHIIDSLACAVGGFGCEAAQAALDLAPTQAADEFAGTVILTERRTAADVAGFINTSMIRYLDFNDAFPSSHPSDCIGGLIAVAGARNTTGADFLTATVVTYEVHNRLTEAAKLRWKGWDQGSAVAVAVAAGLASLRSMSFERAYHAVALAAVQCVPLRATRAGQLSQWKGAATAESVREAVFLSALAERGITGPAQPFVGRHGHWDLITGPFDLRDFPVGIEGDYLIEKTRLKYWPLEYNVQIAVWAALELRAELSMTSVAVVKIGTYWSAWHETGSEPEKWHPTTRETADHSMPYLFAAAYRDGRIDDATFARASYTDPATLDFMQRIAVEVDAEVEARYPETVAIVVTVQTVDGDLITKHLENPRGHECNRMTPDETNDKFTRLGHALLGENGCETILAELWKLGEQRQRTIETVLGYLQPRCDSATRRRM